MSDNSGTDNFAILSLAGSQNLCQTIIFGGKHNSATWHWQWTAAWFYLLFPRMDGGREGQTDGQRDGQTSCKLHRWAKKKLQGLLSQGHCILKQYNKQFHQWLHIKGTWGTYSLNQIFCSSSIIGLVVNKCISLKSFICWYVSCHGTGARIILCGNALGIAVMWSRVFSSGSFNM